MTISAPIVNHGRLTIRDRAQVSITGTLTNFGTIETRGDATAIVVYSGDLLNSGTLDLGSDPYVAPDYSWRYGRLDLATTAPSSTRAP